MRGLQSLRLRVLSGLGILLVFAPQTLNSSAPEQEIGFGEQRVAQLMQVAELWVSTAEGWTSFQGNRLLLRYPQVQQPKVQIVYRLSGDACFSDPHSWHSELAVDGIRVASCSECSCDAEIALGDGPHQVLVKVTDQVSTHFTSRSLLINLEAEGSMEGEGPVDFLEYLQAAEPILEEYRELHNRILDEADSSVEKRFIVVRSSHGLSNTQIEEVTGLLIGIITRRALILDFTNFSYTGPRPVMEYDWGLNIWMDALSPFLSSDSDILDMPRIQNEEYGKYGELLGCEHWNHSMPGRIYLANTLFGYPTAYLNPYHSDFIAETFGPFVFPILHGFLHRPNPTVSSLVSSFYTQRIKPAECSVGLQIRWHHLNAYLTPHQRSTPGSTLTKFLKCAAQVCPLNGQTVFFVATDFLHIRHLLREALVELHTNSMADNAVNLARSCGDGTQACDTDQSSTGHDGWSWLAVDGKKSGYYQQEPCAHSWDDLSGRGTGDPWWMVDLESEREIAGLRLFNRADCCGDSLQGIDVYVGNSPTPTDGSNFKCAANTGVPKGKSLLLFCDAFGRFVFIVKPGEGVILTICEVEVFGPDLIDARDSGMPQILHLEPDDQIGDVLMDAGDHETALADQILLSKCDHIITTRESTLGFVAHASVCKPSFQVSTFEEYCRFIPSTQAGLVQAKDFIHDEWPWSDHKYEKLSCAQNPEVQQRKALWSQGVLDSV